MTEMIDILISNGSLGVFAGFLVWLYTNMQKRMDSLVDKFGEQIRESRAEYKADNADIRARYDVVIQQINQEKSVAERDILSNIESLKDSMQTSSITIAHIKEEVEDIKKLQEADTEKEKSQEKSLLHIRSILTEMRENEKMRVLLAQQQAQIQQDS